MIPLRHTHPPARPPIVNRVLVAANVVVFIAQLFLGAMTEKIIQTFGYMPARHAGVAGQQTQRLIQ